MFVKMVATMLSKKPSDPVPYIYSYLQELQKGIPEKDVKPITDNELNEVRNLQKKLQYYKDILGQQDDA